MYISKKVIHNVFMIICAIFVANLRHRTMHDQCQNNLHIHVYVLVKDAMRCINDHVLIELF